MTETKRCCGHKGHWECADEYPDHMVPVSEFNKERNGTYGVGGRCRKCHTYSAKINNKLRPRHPETGERKMDWKRRTAKSLGGARGTPEWQSYLDKAEEFWLKGKTVAKIKQELPKIQKDPKTKSISVPRETYPREGYVYIFQDMMKPEGVYKIGSTDDVGSRLSNARTWGEFQCVRWFYSDDCKLLERNTHHELSEFKIKKDHMGDEWFQIAEDAAIHKIQELSNASTAV